MADYPCDNHLARYNGPSTRIYVNVYREDQAVKLKLSVCADCCTALLSDMLPHALAQAAEGHWDPIADGEGLDVLWMDAEAATRALRASIRR